MWISDAFFVEKRILKLWRKTVTLVLNNRYNEKKNNVMSRADSHLSYHNRKYKTKLLFSFETKNEQMAINIGTR